MGVEEADKLGVDAIIMGSSGMSDLKGLVIGSISHKVMHTANCRVILVR
jgi:nucleotide-binding universal stress UspA family protein